MEISGVVFRPLPCYSGTGIDTHTLKPSFSSLSFDSVNKFPLNSMVSTRERKFSGISSNVFSDQGHLQYYVSCEKKKEKKNSEMKTIKKKVKVVKGLFKNLSMFSSMSFGLEVEDGLISEVKGKNLTEASEILLAQLQLLKAEEKEIKRKKKEEKARLKSMKMKTDIDCESSSLNSSESSDSECGEVVNMNSLRSTSIKEPKLDESDKVVIPEQVPLIGSSLIKDQNTEENQNGSSSKQDCFTEMNSISTGTSCCSNKGTVQRSTVALMASTSGERIEVCMGGKCKKSGAGELLEEFEKRVGVEGNVAVVGCKCMGKCRDGPNVRVLNNCNSGNLEQALLMEEGGDIRPSPVTNPLCVGVGLEDVGLILANFFGEQERKDFGLVAA